MSPDRLMVGVSPALLGQRPGSRGEMIVERVSARLPIRGRCLQHGRSLLIHYLLIYAMPDAYDILVRGIARVPSAFNNERIAQRQRRLHVLGDFAKNVDEQKSPSTTDMATRCLRKRRRARPAT